MKRPSGLHSAYAQTFRPMNLDLKEYNDEYREDRDQRAGNGSGKKFSQYNEELLVNSTMKMENLLTDRSGKGETSRSIYSKVVGSGD